MISGYLLLVLTLLSSFSQAKLYQVVSLFRHGARYHLNDLYDGNSTRALRGELTAVGMRQHQSLGRTLREQYISTQGFLSENYKVAEMEVFSTQVNRTVESALSQLYGVYPLGNGIRIPYVDKIYHFPPYGNKTDINQQNYALPDAHQPIPVQFDESILPTSCNNLDAQAEKNIQLKLVEYKEMNLTYQPFMRKMATMYNLTAVNFTILQQLYDTLTVDVYLGRPLAPTMTKDDYTNLQHLHNWFNSFKISQNISRAINTFKINKIITEFNNRIRLPTTYPLKWTFLSAHDTDISAAQLDFNISSSRCIEDLYRLNSTTELNCELGTEYASTIIFELHSDNEKEFYVKMRNNGKYVYLCGAKNTSCAYADWSSRAKKIVIPNAAAICGTSKLLSEEHIT